MNARANLVTATRDVCKNQCVYVPSVLTALLWISVVADEDFLACGPEQRGPVDGVVEAEATVVENVDISGTDLIQRLELERGDPTLLQDQEGNAASTGRQKKQVNVTN